MPLVPGFSSRLSVTLGPLAIVGAALTVSAGSVTTHIGVSLVSPTASVGRHFLQLSFLLGPELSPFRCVSPGPLLETCPLSTTSQPFLRLRLDRRCHTLTQTNHNLGSQTLWNLHTNTRPSMSVTKTTRHTRTKKIVALNSLFVRVSETRDRLPPPLPFHGSLVALSSEGSHPAGLLSASTGQLPRHAPSRADALP